jgi:hypothetical protein
MHLPFMRLSMGEQSQRAKSMPQMQSVSMETK